MTLTQDIAARALQAAAGRLTRVAPGLTGAGRDLPAPEPMVADTEAGPVRVQIYRPEGAGQAPPVYLNFHGSGFVVRAPEQDDHICRALAAELGCVVVNVDYDVAPQHRFPVAPTQALALAWWATMAGRKLGWDGKRVALGGQSAGGNLALGACLELPSRIGFRPRALVAVYPPLDLATPPEAKPAPVPRPAISPRLARMFNAAYLPDPAARAAPLASPLLAPDAALSGFAPTLIVLAEHDSLAPEGAAFARRLRAAGVAVTLHREPGVGHGYLQAGPPGAVAATLRAMITHLRPAFGG